MLKNYLVTAWRNLLRNRFYSLLNVLGLAIGLSVGIMILLWVQDERSYERFHTKGERIYKINSHLGTGDDARVWDGAPAPLTVMGARVPEIEQSVRILDNYQNSLFVYGAKKLTPAVRKYADPSFFDIFDFKMVRGSKARPFEGSHSVVLTRSTAQKFFGDEDPLGKILIADNRENFKVSGVMEDFPRNSTLQGDMIFPMSLNAERFTGNGEWKTIDEDLGNYFYHIYFQLKEGADPSVAAAKLSRVYETTRNYPPTGKAFSMQALTSLHLLAADGSNTAMQTVKIFTLVAVFILVIACINYVNLSTARSVVRSKEVSMRKIIGAGRKQLLSQFIIESGLVFILSAVVAILVIRMMLPLYNQLSGKELVFNFSNPNVWLIIAATFFGSLAIASIYPALLLSSFRPIDALKGRFKQGVSNAGFRRILVVSQFVISVVLIIATIVVALQLKYFREKDLGYDREHVLTLQMRPEMESHSDVVREQLKKMKGVSDVSFAMANISGEMPSTGDTEWQGKEKDRTFLIHANGVDERFVPLFQISILAGRNFRGRSDSASFILNETAVREAGIDNPVGKNFSLWSESGNIVGVIKDFNYASLKQKVDPVIFFYQPSNSRIFIKTTGREAGAVIEAVRNIWMNYSPDYPFTYTFVDEDYDRLYRAEQRTGVLFNVFAVVAISISCLGLLGLATYTAQMKKREVGIRKVLGASVARITTILARDFLSLVIIALIIAVPIAWWAMHNWLQDFAYRIHLSWWIFVAGGAAALLIALMTVTIQAVRAALANPVNTLKEE